ncbi:hypothetical protein RM553_14795 [Zunongwangia sp. F363]|uniref:Membrane or secreted protein n=1 Tax=Autumnicola tepida TaxID=3075595 RepID=A0ABU3CCM9_9FLAO|nr:hypothetical protein [Zunongwangia sp. F363]MDT0644102.1 hypothetical protein [Zunongwangia sp. F363]
MRKAILIPFIVFCVALNAQDLEGSWKLIEENGREITDKEVVRIYQDGYYAEGAKDAGTNEFLWALGGEYAEGDYQEMPDFNTKNPKVVGNTFDPKLSFMEGNSKIKINNVTQVQVWKRISENQNDLSGNWVITGRKRDGEISRRTPGERRTIKILGGDRFQWVAFNSATREFFGSGGGTYSAEDGKYVEDIDFFSKDNSRVGAKLDFHYDVQEGEWHHQGKSSKGDPIYEVWSPYAEAYTE